MMANFRGIRRKTTAKISNSRNGPSKKPTL